MYFRANTRSTCSLFSCANAKSSVSDDLVTWLPSRLVQVCRDVNYRGRTFISEQNHETLPQTLLLCSGRVVCLGRDKISRNGDGPTDKERVGSVTLVGAVSPPGGDFSEPMTQSSLRVVGTFWGLDYDLSRRRHFPAINWTNSYTLYKLGDWYKNQVAPDWDDLIREAMALLQEEVELQEIVQLVGPDALADEQKQVLAITRMLREDFLQQSAYDDIDRFCPLSKAYWMLRAILAFHHQATTALRNGQSLDSIISLPVTTEIARMKEMKVDEAPERLQLLINRIESTFREMI